MNCNVAQLNKNIFKGTSINCKGYVISIQCEIQTWDPGY